jgi:hypothetical protein
MMFGILVALNLQTSFLTPPMAMSAYYLKGIAPPQVELWTIFPRLSPRPCRAGAQWQGRDSDGTGAGGEDRRMINV